MPDTDALARASQGDSSGLPAAPPIGGIDGLGGPTMSPLDALAKPTAAVPSNPIVGSNPSLEKLAGDAAGNAGAGVTLAPQHGTLKLVLRGLATALAGASAGMGEKRPGEAAAAGVKTGIGLTERANENRRADTAVANQTAETQSRIKFQNVQAAEAAARAAMYDKQLHQMDTEFQDTHNARTLSQMKELQAMGITPTIIADNHGRGANAALEQLTQSHGGVPNMFILNLGDKIVGYDMGQLNGMSNMRDQVNKISEIQGKGKEAYNSAVWGQMSPEARNQLLQTSLSFFNPMPTKENVDNMLQQYKNWRASYGMNPGADKDTLAKLDSTIDMLDKSRGTFIAQKGQEAKALTEAETPAKIEQATAIAKAEAPIKAATAGAEETARLNADLQSADVQNTAMRLVEGFEDPTQMSKRSRSYDAQLKAADVYSMQKYGKHFDIAQAQSDYKYATNTGTQDRLKYLNSLTGNPVTKTDGILDKLIAKSNSISRTDFPALNDAAAWLRLQSGDPSIVGYRDLLLDAQDQFAKIMQGGGSGGATSDAKIKQAQDLFGVGFNKAQILDSAGTVKDMLGVRKREIIGENRYLVKQYGSGAAAGGPPHPDTHVFSVKAWKAANPNGDENAAREQAKAQNYTIVD